MCSFKHVQQGPGTLCQPNHRWLVLFFFLIVDLWRCLPGLPLYYMLVSLAAWLALIEYSNRPFAWNKTEHGRARSSRYRKPPA